jgi:hypothetical protein
MTTALGLVALALGLTMLYGAVTNRRPDHLLIALVTDRTVGKID